jgi:TetR/AcrR family transcriptional repressor of lmrAB and yxaGH operons
MVRTAGQLLRRQGYAATGWRQVVQESRSPWGSQSHHFPGGKEQLAVEALVRSGGQYRGMLHSALEGTHPADMVEGWSTLAAAQLAESGYSDGCPIATVTLEQAHASDALAVACNTALSSWVTEVQAAVVARGVAEDEARSIATLVIAGIEGGLLLSRAARSGDPLETVGRELAGWLRTRVPA